MDILHISEKCHTNLEEAIAKGPTWPGVNLSALLLWLLWWCVDELRPIWAVSYSCFCITASDTWNIIIISCIYYSLGSYHPTLSLFHGIILSHPVHYDLWSYYLIQFIMDRDHTIPPCSFWHEIILSHPIHYGMR